MVGKWAGAHSSLSETKWPAGSRPAGRIYMDSFSGSGRHSECVLPLLSRSPAGVGLWASGEDASGGPGLQAGTASEAMGHAPLSPLDTLTP